MAITDDAFDSTELAGFIAETWPGMVLEELFAPAVAANFFTDLSSLGNGHDIIHIPDIFTNAFSGQTQATQGAEVTTEAPAQTDTTLTINTHKVFVRTKVRELLEALNGVISSQAYVYA